MCIRDRPDTMNFAPKLPISWRGDAVNWWRKVWNCTTRHDQSDMKVKKKLKKTAPESLPRNVTHDAESWFMTDACNFMTKGAISWHKVLIHNTRHDIEFWRHEIIAPRHEIPKQFHDGKVRISCRREGRLSGCVIIPRGYYFPQGAKYRVSGFIPPNKQTNKQIR